MKDMMLDLETMGNNSYAAIIQVGACYFDPVTAEIGDTFLMNVELASSLSHGLEVNAETIYWWLEQSEEARKSIAAKPRYKLGEVLTKFKDFSRDAERVWSHSTFDFVILLNSCARCKVMPKFHYKSERDLRTLVDLAQHYEKAERAGTHHNALDDCIYQVQYTVKALNILKARKVEFEDLTRETIPDQPFGMINAEEVRA